MITIKDPAGYLDYGHSTFMTLTKLSDAEYSTYAYRACREGFAELFHDKLTHVVYNHHAKQGGMDIKLATAFWREIEKKLGLKESVIHECNKPNTLIIEVDPWWSINSTRRSFFTLFLRCACVHYKGDFDAAFKAYSLAAPIIPAITHFLNGNTTPTYDTYELGDRNGYKGVYAKFIGKSQEDINKLLVKAIFV